MISRFYVICYINDEGRARLYKITYTPMISCYMILYVCVYLSEIGQGKQCYYTYIQVYFLKCHNYVNIHPMLYATYSYFLFNYHKNISKLPKLECILYYIVFIEIMLISFLFILAIVISFKIDITCGRRSKNTIKMKPIQCY